MKLCKDCKWSAKIFFFPWSIAKCKSPNNLTAISRVNGEKVARIEFCENAREFDQFCGKDAKWFTAK